MIKYISSFEFQSTMALFIYWIPVFICLFVYLVRGIEFYRNDLRECSKEYYRPELTIGIIVWWFFCSVTPCVNLFALVFDCASSVFKFLGRTLNIPLVKKRTT